MQHLNETFVSCQKGIMSLLGKIFPPPPSGHTGTFLAFITDLDERWVTTGIWGTGKTSNNMCLWNDQLSIISTQLPSPWLLNVATVYINCVNWLYDKCVIFIFKWMLFTNPLAHYWSASFCIPCKNYSTFNYTVPSVPTSMPSPQLSRNPTICFLRSLGAVRNQHHWHSFCALHSLLPSSSSFIIIIIITASPPLLEESLHPLMCR